MKLTDKDKKNILFFLLSQIALIADKEYQKRVWIRGEGPECNDFDDTACNFLHEGDAIIENYEDFGITDKQYHLLANFRDKFEAFSENNNWPQKFIDTPEWGKITEMAKEVLDAFHYRRKSQDNNPSSLA